MTRIEGDEASTSTRAQVETAAGGEHRGGSWGAWLFRATVVATLVYSWWLLIYSHGIASHHP